MPISGKGQVYQFSKCYEKRFKSALQNRSLAIYFWSDNNFKLIAIERTKLGTIKTVRINERMRILFYKALLPRHCDVKLVEQALALLQIYPEERELLNNIANYIKNDLFEYIGYWGVLIGIGSCCSAGIACAVIIVIYPLLFHSYLGIFSICIIATTITFFVLLDVFYDSTLGLKFGRWIGDQLEGIQQKPIHLKEFAEKLRARVHGDEIEEALEEATHEEILMPLDENSSVESQKYRLARQRLDYFFWSTGSIMPNTQLNTLSECQRTIYQYSEPCSLDSRP